MGSTTLAVLGPLWIVLGGGLVLSAVRSRRTPAALEWGCISVCLLWAGGGALVNLGYLVAGGTYTGFAEGAWLPGVRSAWESEVVPHQPFYIGLLVIGEGLAGMAVLLPGAPRVASLVALIAFTVTLVVFGWGFLLWSVPVGGSLVLLLRAELRRQSAGRPVRPLTGTIR